VLEVAHQEIEKLNALLAAKLERGESLDGKKGFDEEQRRQAVRQALEEDREERRLRFAYTN
jgi:hypothetical protein